VTIEYVMLGGLNDTQADRERLAKMMRGMPVKINLIPYNDNAGLGFNSPAREWVHDWQRYMNNQGLQAFIRWSKGADIAAACGQLATNSKKPSRLPVVDQIAA
jgi:23S rRNA (adenine2503-C2)-methyltransferase